MWFVRSGSNPTAESHRRRWATPARQKPSAASGGHWGSPGFRRGSARRENVEVDDGEPPVTGSFSWGGSNRWLPSSPVARALVKFQRCAARLAPGRRWATPARQKPSAASGGHWGSPGFRRGSARRENVEVDDGEPPVTGSFSWGGSNRWLPSSPVARALVKFQRCAARLAPGTGWHDQ